ncbi:helix-turn-helix domain-containing protein [Streptantibioticus silvisoli]|uniref:Helix-turn-helix transcriptional regulator n=1 Tax=Streptantibioticus silvisoli TaxID=2705255 RepID=A0ABT6W4L0_9ACTN|nr:helix-turn-helix transcriptional regulator [Streptantibioticus silvisoli]MDI5965692.1 helix-turn-helix transcriptional regulator [Streptantibioticus silvisoli]
MSTAPEEHTGTRIAAHRRLAGLTQRGLADRIPYSYRLLRAVERGERTATPDLVATVARTLRVDVTALTGQPYITELQQDRLAGMVRPIREALDLYDLGANPEMTLPPDRELVAAAEKLCILVRATKLHEAAHTLPGVIAQITTAAYRSPSTELWAALASTYRTAHDIAVKLGYYDLSTVALDRMDWAAERASDPLLAAVRQYMRALTYFREGEYTIGLRLISAGQQLVPHEDTSISALAVAGQLHLGASIIAARSRKPSTVATHLEQAGEFALRTGEAGHVHYLSFGPTNVGAHDVSAHVEMGLYDHALTRARNLNPPRDWAMSRVAHIQVDQARCELETGNHEAAVKSLSLARKLAPQQTRYHPGARETIKGLVYTSRRTPGSLDHLAAWVGL